MCSNSASPPLRGRGHGHFGGAQVVLMLAQSSCEIVCGRGTVERASPSAETVMMERRQISGGQDHSNRSRSRRSSQRDYCEPTWCAGVRKSGDLSDWSWNAVGKQCRNTVRIDQGAVKVNIHQNDDALRNARWWLAGKKMAEINNRKSNRDKRKTVQSGRGLVLSPGAIWSLERGSCGIAAKVHLVPPNWIAVAPSTTLAE